MKLLHSQQCLVRLNYQKVRKEQLEKIQNRLNKQQHKLEEYEN
jgi:hypothetical protein